MQDRIFFNLFYSVIYDNTYRHTYKQHVHNVKVLFHLRLLHLTITSSSNLLPVRLQRSGLKTFPATLNSLSTGAEEAGMARYFETNLDKIGYFT